MTDRSLTPSSLGRLVGRSPTDSPDIRIMRAKLWHEFGIAVIPPDEVRNDIDRQVVTNVAARLYGKRITTGPNAKDASV